MLKKIYPVLESINVENTHKKQNLTYWWGFLSQFEPCVPWSSPAPLSWTVQRPRQQLGKRTHWHFPLGNKTATIRFCNCTAVHDQTWTSISWTHHHSILGRIRHFQQSLSDHCRQNVSFFSTSEYCILYHTFFFFFISNEENSVCGIIVSFLIYLAVHTRVYVTIHELNMLRHCTTTSVVLSINRTM